MLKKCIITFSVILMVISTSFANEKSICFKGGINFSSIRGDWADLLDSSLHSNQGFVGGIAFNVALSDLIVIQPELLFSSKGYNHDTNEYDGWGIKTIKNNHFKMNYLVLPVLINFEFFSKSTFSPRIYLGPEIGFLLNAYETVDRRRESISDSFNPIDIGTTIGGGLKIRAGSGYLLLEVRYTFGMSSIYEGSVEGWKNTNKTLGIMLGYGFTFPRS